MARLLHELLRRQGALLSIKEADSGRYAFVNGTMARLFGQPVESILGRPTPSCRPALATACGRPNRLRSRSRQRWPASTIRLARGLRHEFAVLRLATRGRTPARGAGCRRLDRPRPAAAERRAVAHALEQLEQQQRANEQLRRESQDQALRDSATGLYNRAHFEDQLRREVDLSTREHREFALVSIAHRPAASDAVSALGARAPRRACSRRSAGCCAATRARWMPLPARRQTASRVLLSGVGLATAHSRMEGLRRQCATQIVVLDGADLGFTVSMGVASFPHTAHTQDELLAACDMALAEARRRGGNHVTLASIRFEPA